MVLVLRLVQKSTGAVLFATMKTHFSTTTIICQQVAIKSSTRMLDKQISLRHCQSSPQTASRVVNDSSQEAQELPPLVVLLTWLAAQEKHIEKYRSLYLSRGFDVLTVKTSPLDLLLPANGARKIAQNCVLALQKQLSDYPAVVLHAFSVGAYQFGEMLLEMRQEASERRLDRRIKGVIFDSVVPIEEVANGVSRSMTSNPFLYKLMKSLINTHMMLFRNVSTKYYEASSEAAWGNYLRVPALILVSKNDQIGTATANQRLTNVWRGLGIDVTWKCWEKSGHVQHLPKHPIEYQATIDEFLDKIQLNH